LSCDLRQRTGGLVEAHAVRRREPRGLCGQPVARGRLGDQEVVERRDAGDGVARRSTDGVAPTPPVPLVIASETEAVLEVRLLSSRRTVTTGAIVAPDSVSVGCWPNASWVAGQRGGLRGLQDRGRADRDRVGDGLRRGAVDREAGDAGGVVVPEPA
jgi:hypothetical protein